MRLLQGSKIIVYKQEYSVQQRLNFEAESVTQEKK